MFGYPRGSYTSHTQPIASRYASAIEPRSLATNPTSQSKLLQGQIGMGGTLQQTLDHDQLRHSTGTLSTTIQSNFGVPLSESDKASSTFAIRARQAGIPDWNERVVKGLRGNDSVFDGRWVLNPDEAWNVPARRNSGLTISPRSQRSKQSVQPSTNPTTESSIEERSVESSEQYSPEVYEETLYGDSSSHLGHPGQKATSVQRDQKELHRRHGLVDKKSSEGLEGLVDSWQRSMKMG